MKLISSFVQKISKDTQLVLPRHRLAGRQSVLPGFLDLVGCEAGDPIVHHATVWVVMRSSEGESNGT